jgi:hypothetical protein
MGGQWDTMSLSTIQPKPPDAPAQRRGLEATSSLNAVQQRRSSTFWPGAGASSHRHIVVMINLGLVGYILDPLSPKCQCLSSSLVQV